MRTHTHTHTHTLTHREAFLSLKPVYSQATAGRVYRKLTPASGHHFTQRKEVDRTKSASYHLWQSQKPTWPTRLAPTRLNSPQAGDFGVEAMCPLHLFMLPFLRLSWSWRGAPWTNKEKVMKEGPRLPKALREPVVEPNDARPDFLEWKPQ